MEPTLQVVLGIMLGSLSQQIDLSHGAFLHLVAGSLAKSHAPQPTGKSAPQVIWSQQLSSSQPLAAQRAPLGFGLKPP
jgi:hypothetical protein